MREGYETGNAFFEVLVNILGAADEAHRAQTETTSIHHLQRETAKYIQRKVHTNEIEVTVCLNVAGLQTEGA